MGASTSNNALVPRYDEQFERQWKVRFKLDEKDLGMPLLSQKKEMYRKANEPGAETPDLSAKQKSLSNFLVNFQGREELSAEQIGITTGLIP